jgi:hypothetical protein
MHDLDEYRIVIVEDDASWANRLYYALWSGLGGQIVVAQSMNQAISLADKRRRWTGLVIDAFLPCGDKTILAETPDILNYDAALAITIAFRRKFPGLPIIVWSGQGRNRVKEHISRILEMDRTLYVEKEDGCEEEIFGFFKKAKQLDIMAWEASSEGGSRTNDSVCGCLAGKSQEEDTQPVADFARNYEGLSGVGQYDVFLAHNSQDKSDVRTIAESLKQRGIRPWIDLEQIPPGCWFQDVIQAAIPAVKSAAIFIGPHGIGRWQAVELRTFVSQCVDQGLPVIPVLLPGVNDVPENLLFLRELNWVKFKNQLDEKEALDRLQWGITGKKVDW